MSTRPFIARTWSHAIRGASSTPSRSGVAAFAELRKATTPILQSSRRDISTDSLPAIIRPSFWRSITPKFLRSGSAIREAQTPVKKEWNPATFFIIIFLLIGSQAIQIIALHRSYDNFSNQTEAKLALLREVVRRVQAGEEFDVKAALGTGNKAKEKEWEQGRNFHHTLWKTIC